MEKTKKNILVPVDFSDQSLLALEQSYSMARMINAEIYLLHIIVETSPFWGIFSAKEKEDVVEKFKKKLDDFAEIISKKSGIKVNTIVEKGKLLDKILEICDRLEVRYLIVGTVIKDNFREKIIGSNAIRIIRDAKFPVLTIKGKRTTRECRNIVLPLDMTKETRQKVGHAVALARYFKSTVHAISVGTSKDYHLLARLEGQVEQVCKLIEKDGIKCIAKFIRPGASNDSIGKQLLDYSYKIDADLI
ncbi:MAG: universal stress protein, partial [Bacteroidetes bacterium]|nr:universal stress protein [Bacteroidota bacterium]